MQSMDWLYPNQMLHCATVAPPPPKQLRRWETELYCVGTTQPYVYKKKPWREGVLSISLSRHKRNSHSHDVYGDVCLNVALDGDLCWHNKPPGYH